MEISNNVVWYTGTLTRTPPPPGLPRPILRCISAIRVDEQAWEGARCLEFNEESKQFYEVRGQAYRNSSHNIHILTSIYQTPRLSLWKWP